MMQLQYLPKGPSLESRPIKIGLVSRLERPLKIQKEGVALCFVYMKKERNWDKESSSVSIKLMATEQDSEWVNM